MKHQRLKRFGVAIAGGAAMALAFPPSPLYPLAFIALIPLLWLLQSSENRWQYIKESYVYLFVWNLCTLYWIGGYTHGKDPFLMAGGAAVIVVNSLFMLIPLLFVLRVKNRLREWWVLVAFPMFWISFEFLHSQSELAFPWLLVGNTQSTNVYGMQIAEYISAYGLSLWVIMINCLLFAALFPIRPLSRENKNAHLLMTAAALVLVLPMVFGFFRVNSFDEGGRGLRVAIVQPDIDPWEKWGEGSVSKWESYELQLSKLISMTLDVTKNADEGQNPQLVVWPETAVPFYILLPQNESYLRRVQNFVDSTRIDIFTGIPHAVFFDSVHAPRTAHRIQGTDDFYESYNSATLFSRGNSPERVYRKSLLVPLGERVPYAEYVSFLVDYLQWGVGISGWGKGSGIEIFKYASDRDTLQFGAVICFESIFPSYVRQFSEAGAEFLVIVTNDSWYGNTSGPYQHEAYARLRAVEQRKWIIRCANGGVSSFISPIGIESTSSRMFTTESLTATIRPNDDLTFYARYGDVIPYAMLLCALLAFGSTFVRK